MCLGSVIYLTANSQQRSQYTLSISLLVSSPLVTFFLFLAIVSSFMYFHVIYLYSSHHDDSLCCDDWFLTMKCKNSGSDMLWLSDRPSFSTCLHGHTTLEGQVCLYDVQYYSEFLVISSHPHLQDISYSVCLYGWL